MILTADSEVVRQANRKRTGNGWHTTFIGGNRHTIAPGAKVPEPGTLYPMAFLVEKDAGAVVKPHFHQADQYQVVVSGGGRLGTHDVASVAVHYTDCYSAYGPIVAADEGIAWFTLRNAWDPGARYMPAERALLREVRSRHQHREATAGPLQAASAAELAQTEGLSCVPVIEHGADGLATWRYRMPAGASVVGAEPADGGGQFWLVLAGGLSANGGALLPPNSCVFVAPDAAALRAVAGPGGAEALCMQFPVLARH
jgi:hypothetical protein